ncbi:MAG: hypothetical protein ACI8TQ_002473 [Planctomycetota bacterium]|jgi:hypothetical protein
MLRLLTAESVALGACNHLRQHQFAVMSKFVSPLKLAFALLSVLTASCFSTQYVEVEVLRAPEIPIENHRGVGLYELESKTPTELNLADRLTIKLSQALSDGAQGFGFDMVSPRARDEVLKYLENSGKSWDNFEGGLDDNFGRKITMTGFFEGKVILTPQEDDLKARDKTFDEKTETWTKEWYRTGYNELTVDIGFNRLGTGVVRNREFVKKTPMIEEVADRKEDVARINYGPDLSNALDDILLEFKTAFVVTSQRARFRLFVGDGTFNWFWESGEYPLLTSGFNRMKNGQFDLASQDFAAQAQELLSNDNTSERAVMEARVWYNQGIACEANRQFVEALKFYEKASLAFASENIFSDAITSCKNSKQQFEQILKMRAADVEDVVPVPEI